jgi:catechol 2,3-dioxygenase-like lactoylglutathione lyase family enzyme
MLPTSEVIAFVGSADLDQARVFYEQTLGLRMIERNDFACVFEKGVAFLRYDGMDQDEGGVWTTPDGDQVAWFADPGGNVLSLTQFAF